MTSFTIADTDLDGIRDQVVLVTGASSGIGLATVKRLLQHGAKVFATDVNPLPEPENSAVPFLKADVSSWSDQVKLFNAVKEKFGKVDHVFANAGIGLTVNLLEDDVDKNGDLLPPNLNTINVNLLGCIYTVKLAIHHIKQNPGGGSIVMTASSFAFSRFAAVDYSVSKQGVVGLLRSLYKQLHPILPIRINAVAPGWTATNIVPSAFTTALNSYMQTPDVVARSALVLMADKKRHGDCIYSEKGKFWEIEGGERGYHAKQKENIPGSDIEGNVLAAEKALMAFQEAAAAAKT